MNVHQLRNLTLTFAVTVSFAIGCSVSGPRGAAGKVKHTDQGTAWAISYAYHPGYSGVIPTDAEVEQAMTDAGDKWRHVYGGLFTPDVDVATKISFVRYGNVDSWVPTGNKWYGPDYNIIIKQTDLDDLVDQNDVKTWILLVKSTPRNVAQARAPGMRVVIPERWKADASLFAHEFGHNAGCDNRVASSPLAYLKEEHDYDDTISVMTKYPDVGDQRELVRAHEREKVDLWTP
jgi:hypothetical protein